MIVVFGASGQVGMAIARLLPDAMLATRSLVDLSRPRVLPSVLAELKPTAIINASGWTDVDAAEADRSGAHAINTEAPGAMAEYAETSGCRLVTFSTDYVFDGSRVQPYAEDNATHPLNVYGETKLAGETRVLSINPSALVVRTSLVISATHDNFLSQMLMRVARGFIARATTDQVCAPTFAPDLARSVVDNLLYSGMSGVVHVTNRGECSRFELVSKAADMAGFEATVEPALHTAFPSQTQRPLYSTLVSARVDTGMPDWTDSLRGIADIIGRKLRANIVAGVGTS